MFRLAAPCALFAGALLFAGPALAQQRLPTIAPDQYTAEQKKAAEEFLAARKVPVFGPFEPMMYSPEVKRVPDRDARRQRLRRDLVDFAESLVPDHQSARGIKHAQPVGHVGKRAVKSQILFRKRTSKLSLFPNGKQQAQSICAQISRKFDGGEKIQEHDRRQGHVDQSAALMRP
jgi:hypothetical protein